MTNLILIGGLAAAGKTTLGREMARITKFAFLDKDTVTQPLVEALLAALDAPDGIDDRQSVVYLSKVRPSEYQSFLDVVIENVKLSVPTIAVAPFVREMADQQWLDQLQQQIPDAIIHKLWIVPPAGSLYERTRSRGLTRDRWKLDDWEEYLRSCQAVKPCDSCILIEPHAGEEVHAFANRILRLLQLV